MQVTKLRLLEAPLRLPDKSGVDFVASAAVTEGPTTAQRNHVSSCVDATYVDADTCLCSVFKEPVPSSGRGRTLPGSPYSVNRKVAVRFRSLRATRLSGKTASDSRRGREDRTRSDESQGLF